MLKGTCSKCGKKYEGWWLQVPGRDVCECGAPLIVEDKKWDNLLAFGYLVLSIISFLISVLSGGWFSFFFFGMSIVAMVIGSVKLTPPPVSKPQNEGLK